MKKFGSEFEGVDWFRASQLRYSMTSGNKENERKNCEKLIKELRHNMETMKEFFENFLNDYRNKVQKHKMKIETQPQIQPQLRNQLSPDYVEHEFILEDSDPDEDFYVLGNCEELGNWNSKKAVKMKFKNGKYKCKVSLPKRHIEYKFIRKSYSSIIYYPPRVKDKLVLNF